MKSLFKKHLEQALKLASEVCEHEGLDYIAIHSGKGQYYFKDDQQIPFKQIPLFKYFCPADGAGHLLVITSGSTPKLYFRKTSGFWHQPQTIGDSFWEDFFEINEFESAVSIGPLSGKGVWVGDHGSDFETLFSNPLPYSLIEDSFDQHRTRKSDYEIQCTHEATKVSVAGHNAAKEAFLQEASELEIHHAYLNAARITERDLPYLSIVGMNQNAATLHYEKKQTQYAGSTLLIDAGARFQGYCSDISRTYVSRAGLGKNAPSESSLSIFKYLLEQMEALQLSICERVKPGVSYVDLHEFTLRKTIDIAIDIELIQGIDADQAYVKNLAQVFFPHGLGHFLGLQVHDVGGKLGVSSSYPYLRNCRMVEASQIFTIEPGFYFIPQLLTKEVTSYINTTLFEKLAPCGGIRIEDNLLVTEAGHENITRKYLN